MGNRGVHALDQLRSTLGERAGAGAFLAAMLLVAGLSALEVVFFSKPNDLLSFYVAAKAASTGADFYDHAQLERIAAASQLADRVYPYLYPPFLAHVLRPFTAVELPLAHVIWLMLGVAAFAASVALVLLSIRRAGASAPAAAALSWSLLFGLGALLVSALPLRNNLLVGQVNPLVLLFIALAVRSHLLGKSLFAGAWLAPAILIKLTPGVLLLFFLARGNYRALLSCVAAVTVLALLTVPFGAAPDWVSFVRHLPERNYGATIPGLFEPTSLWNFAPAGWLARLLPQHTDWVPLLSLLILLLPCYIAMRMALRAETREGDHLAFANFFPLIVLASPLTYLHHLVYLLPAAALWLASAWRQQRHFVFGMTLAALFVAGADWPSLYDRLLPEQGPALTSLNLYAVFVLMCCGWWLAAKTAPSAQRRPVRFYGTDAEAARRRFAGRTQRPRVTQQMTPFGKQL